MALARRRKLKAAKDKEGKLDAMVIKPALSRLRTGAVSRRKKGGQTLMDLAKRRKKPAVKPAAKRPASSQPSKFGARIPVESRSPATKAQQPKRKATPKPAPRRTSKFAPGAGGALRGGTISKTDPRWSAAHGPGAMSGAIKRAKKSPLGKLIDLPIDEGLIAGGSATKAAAAAPGAVRAAVPVVKAAATKSKKILTEANKMARQQWKAYKKQLQKEADAAAAKTRRSAAARRSAATRRRNAAARRDAGSPTGTLAERRAWRRLNPPQP